MLESDSNPRQHITLPKKWARWTFVAVFGITGLCVCVWLSWKVFVRDAGYGKNDFVGLYTGGRLVLTDGLYDSKREKLEQRVTGYRMPAEQFIRLPYVGLLLKPLTLLRYDTADWVWEALSVLACGGFFLLWPCGSPNAKYLMLCWSLPVFVSLWNGQDASFVLLWLALATSLARKKRDFAAGMAFSLCAEKFHFFVLLPLWLAAQRRYRILSGLAAGGLMLLGLSFLAGGWNWPVRYIAFLRSPEIHPNLSHAPNLHGLASYLPHGIWLEIGMSLVVVAATWPVVRRPAPLEWGLSGVLVAGLLLSVHAYPQDCTLLLPAELTLLSHGTRALGRIGLLFASPIPFVLLQFVPHPPLAVIAQGALVVWLLVMASVSLRSQRRQTVGYRDVQTSE